jgi:hypothetical protein
MSSRILAAPPTDASVIITFGERYLVVWNVTAVLVSDMAIPQKLDLLLSEPGLPHRAQALICSTSRETANRKPLA